MRIGTRVRWVFGVLVFELWDRAYTWMLGEVKSVNVIARVLGIGDGMGKLLLDVGEFR